MIHIQFRRGPSWRQVLFDYLLLRALDSVMDELAGEAEEVEVEEAVLMFLGGYITLGDCVGRVFYIHPLSRRLVFWIRLRGRWG